MTISASVSPIRTAAGFGLEPRPNVMYPVRPVNAPIALAEAVTGSGVEMSVAVMLDIENMA